MANRTGRKKAVYRILLACENFEYRIQLHLRRTPPRSPVSQAISADPESLVFRSGGCGGRLIKYALSDSEVEHQLKHRGPTCKTGVVWSEDRRNMRLDDAQTLRDDIDTMTAEGIPLDAGSPLIGIAELAKDERRAPIPTSSAQQTG